MFNITYTTPDKDTQTLPMESIEMLADWLATVNDNPAFVYVDRPGVSIQLQRGNPDKGSIKVVEFSPDKKERIYTSPEAAEADFLARVRRILG